MKLKVEPAIIFIIGAFLILAASDHYNTPEDPCHNNRKQIEGKK